MTKTESNLRLHIRNVIRENLAESDVFGSTPTTTSDGVGDVGDALDDFEKEIKRTDIESAETEAIGLTLAGIALSAPEIIKLIGKFVNLLKKIPGLKSLSGDKLIALGDKYHHKITGAFEYIIKKAGVSDPAKAKKFANIIHHTVIAILLIAGGVSMSSYVTQGNMSSATLKAAMNAVKSKEIVTFLIKGADAIV
jgi:hypothetical protein